MRQQRGFSLLVVMAMGIVMAAVVLTFFKVVPVYSEYYAIKKSIDEMAAKQGTSDTELRKDFARNMVVQDITSVRPADLLIVSTSTRIGVGVRYRREVPLIANIGLVFSFEHQAGEPVLKP